MALRVRCRLRVRTLNSPWFQRKESSKRPRRAILALKSVGVVQKPKVLSEELVVVTRKGQVTIPVEHRRRYKIREGMKLRVMDTPSGLVLKPLTPIEDLAGIDAGKISPDQMRKRLDEMRSKDRY